MIQLPIQKNTFGNPVINPDKSYQPEGFIPDWDYMATYSWAIEKLVIKDVVAF